MKTREERFWNKVDKSGGPNACWTWTAAKTNAGYGVFGTEKQTTAHRVSFEMCYGQIPDGQVICHKCDVPSCVNPAHLFAGTQHENMRDAVRKGRTAHGDRNGTRTRPERRACGERHGSKTRPDRVRRGELHSNATLTDTQISAIRDTWLAGGTTQRAIAKQFGLSQSHVSRIVRLKRRATTSLENPE